MCLLWAVMQKIEKKGGHSYKERLPAVRCLGIISWYDNQVLLTRTIISDNSVKRKQKSPSFYEQQSEDSFTSESRTALKFTNGEILKPPLVIFFCLFYCIKCHVPWWACGGHDRREETQGSRSGHHGEQQRLNLLGHLDSLLCSLHIWFFSEDE